MLRKLLLIGAAFIAAPAHACPGGMAEYHPLQYEPIPANAAPVVAKVSVVQREFDKPTRLHVLFRVKVDQTIAGELPSEIVMAVRYATSCDRYPMVADRGYVAGEIYEGVLYVASWRDGKIDNRPGLDVRPHLPGK